MSKYAIKSDSEFYGRCLPTSVMVAVIWIKPLNLKSDPKDICTVFKTMIGMEEEG